MRKTVPTEPHPDEPIERLLRASLRDVPHRASTPCVEPEALAAWADGALTRDERRVVESHIATCSSCSAMVGAFARAAPDSIPAHGWLSGWRLGWLVASASLAAAVTTAWILLSVNGLRPDDSVTTAARVEQDQTAPLAPAPAVETPMISVPPREEPNATPLRSPVAGGIAAPATIPP